jgi:hypothetical protein
MFRCPLLLTIAILSGMGCEPREVGRGCPLAGNCRLKAVAPNQYQVRPAEWDDETRPIPANIVEVASDKRFVLAKRVPPAEPGRLPDEPPESFASGDVEYWILDVQGPYTHGPLSEEQFADKRRELDVSSKLQLQMIPRYEDRWKRYEAARYNVYFWLTFAIPAVVMTLAALVRSWWRWSGLALLSFFVTATASGQSIFEKWRIRDELLPEWQFESTGNLAFSYVIAPVEGLAYTAAFASIGLLVRYRRKIFAFWTDEHARYR